jgi:NADPH2:quinone reductase
VLVRVAAAGVNRPDVMQRQGRYPARRASDLPGLEIAGEIVALGAKVSGLSIGDKVTALLPGGGYAAYAVAAAPLCLPVPAGISMVEAAAIPETFFTVWTNLIRSRPMQGRRHGTDSRRHQRHRHHGHPAGNGLGSARFATAGSDDKARACERLGAVSGINYRTEDFVEVMRAPPAAEASMSPWTWWPAATSRAIWTSPRSRAESS